MRFFACVLLAAAAVAGCGETAAPTLPPNAGRDAGVDLDGGIDGGSGGLGGSGGMGGDGGVGGVGGSVGGGSWCTTASLGGCPACPDEDALCDDADMPCAVGEVCVSTGCKICLSTGCDDVKRCFVTGGGACDDDADCGNPAYKCNQSIGRCLRTDSGCDDSNDCLAGFACENNVCMDRRVPCETGSDCPHGFTCFFPSADQRFCRRITRPCADHLDCLVLGVPCGDADGVGAKECMPALMPNTPGAVSCDPTQCMQEAAPVCESAVEGTGAVCGRFGLCASVDDCVDCASVDDCVDGFDFECRDLWGDGRAECVLWPGSCGDSSECGPRSVCASPRPGAPPACVGGPAM
jgi:hypothetical protein